MVLTAFLCVCMLPTAALEAAESPLGQSIDIPVEITAEGAVPSEPETYVVSLKAVNDSAPMPEGAEGGTAGLQINGPGESAFSFHFDKPGVYQYQISQTPGSKSNCVYDSTLYTLYMYVTNAQDGGLDINAYLEKDDDEGKPEKAAFHNVYTGEAKYDPPLKKIVDEKSGKAPADSVFTFQMIPDDPSYPMPDNKEASFDSSTGALTMDIKGGGSYEFGWMYFDQSHCGKTFVYTVKEIDNGESGYSYDRNIYKLTVKVVPAEDGIALETFITDETGQVSEIVFTNTYTGKEETPEKEEEVTPDKPDNPVKPDKPGKKPSNKGGKKTGKSSSKSKSGSKVKTGDETNIRLWVSITAISLIMVLALLFLHKKNRNEK